MPAPLLRPGVASCRCTIARMPLKSSLRLTAVRRITVYGPASRRAWLALLAGDPAAVEADPAVAPLLAVLRAQPEFGALGPYRNVFELSGGHESFTPDAGAQPTFGHAGETSTTASVAITTYVAAGVAEQRLTDLVALLAAAHPWELPVIEVCAVQVLAPGEAHD